MVVAQRKAEAHASVAVAAERGRFAPAAWHELALAAKPRVGLGELAELGGQAVHDACIEHRGPVADAQDGTGPDRRIVRVAARVLEVQEQRALGDEPRARGMDRPDEADFLGHREHQTQVRHVLAGEARIKHGERDRRGGQVIACVRLEHLDAAQTAHGSDGWKAPGGDRCPVITARTGPAPTRDVARSKVPQRASLGRRRSRGHGDHGLEGRGLEVGALDPQRMPAIARVEGLEPRAGEVRIEHAAAELQVHAATLDARDDERRVIEMRRHEHLLRAAGQVAPRDQVVAGIVAPHRQPIGAHHEPLVDPGHDAVLAAGRRGERSEFQ